MLILVISDLHIPHQATSLPAAFRKLLVPGKIGKILCLGNLVTDETLEYLRTIAPDVICVPGDADLMVSGYGGESRVITVPVHEGVGHEVDGGKGEKNPSQLLRIGMIHGHQVLPWGDPGALGAIARELDVDILLHGHTHRFAAWEEDGRYYINPGSATGIPSCVSSSILIIPDDTEGHVPSFVLMDTAPPAIVSSAGENTRSDSNPSLVSQATILLYIYRLLPPLVNATNDSPTTSASQVKVERMQWLCQRLDQQMRRVHHQSRLGSF